MKTLKLFVMLIMSTVSLVVSAQNSEKLTNQKVIELTNKKLGSELIMELFNTYICEFKTDINSILELKRNNVAEDVIHEMMKRSKQGSSVHRANGSGATSNRDAGIYVYHNKDGKDVFTKIYPSVVNNTKSGGYGAHLAKSFTMGLAKSSTKSELSGPQANVKCPQESTFYFYFDKTSDYKGDWWFNTASSPNEFSLIKLALNKKGNMREFRSGTSDAYSYSTGVDVDQKIAFTFEEIKPNVFVVTTNEKLSPGEYCFLYSSQTPAQFTNNKLFDFSVLN